MSQFAGTALLVQVSYDQDDPPQEPAPEPEPPPVVEPPSMLHLACCPGGPI